MMILQDLKVLLKSYKRRNIDKDTNCKTVRTRKLSFGVLNEKFKAELVADNFAGLKSIIEKIEAIQF